MIYLILFTADDGDDDGDGERSRERGEEGNGSEVTLLITALPSSSVSLLPSWCFLLFSAVSLQLLGRFFFVSRQFLRPPLGFAFWFKIHCLLL